MAFLAKNSALRAFYKAFGNGSVLAKNTVFATFVHIPTFCPHVLLFEILPPFAMRPNPDETRNVPKHLVIGKYTMWMIFYRVFQKSIFLLKRVLNPQIVTKYFQQQRHEA